MGTSSRRQVLGMLGVAVAGGIGLSACGKSTKGAAKTTPAAPGGSAALATPIAPGTDTVLVIRHGEKPNGSGAPYGITQDGEQSVGSLTVRGWARAGALVELFAPADGVPVRAGLLRPDAVYAAKPGADKSQRPAQTVSVVADRLGVPLNTKYAKGDEAALVREIGARHGVTLVSWQHEEIPAMADAFGAVTPAPPKQWPDDRFDVVWVFTRAASGWSFAQRPQLLLPGDRDDVIS